MRDFGIFGRNPGSLQNHFSYQIKSHQSREIEKFCVYYHKVAKLPKCPPTCEISRFLGVTLKVYKTISQTKYNNTRVAELKNFAFIIINGQNFRNAPPACEISGFSDATHEVCKTISLTNTITPESRN